MIYMIDIDGTICRSENGDYPNAEPMIERIVKINRLFDDGHTIIYWTARGGNSGKDWTELTTSQLHEWGCRFHELRMKKPVYDLWIDDKAIHSEEYFK